MIRDWLSAMLRGESPPWPFPGAVTHDSIANEANSEGVISLLHERIAAASPLMAIPADFQEHITLLARKKAQQSLMREAQCRRILACLHEAGIEVLLLKGSALAYWAYSSAHLRECSDIDLLFSSHQDAQRAIGLLNEMDYTLRDPALAGDLVSFEQTCVGPSMNSPGLEIDLHWRLSSSPIFAYAFSFDELHASAIALPKLGTHAFGLSPVHAFLNACMHRVQNMAEGSENSLKWLYDLHLLCAQFSDAQWQALTALAVDRKLTGVCLDGMLVTQQVFLSDIPKDSIVQLLDAQQHERMDVKKMHRWFYIQCMSFMAFPSMRLRLRWLRQRLLPNADYLKTRHGGQNGMSGLVFRRIAAGLRRLL